MALSICGRMEREKATPYRMISCRLANGDAAVEDNLLVARRCRKFKTGGHEDVIGKKI